MAYLKDTIIDGELTTTGNLSICNDKLTVNSNESKIDNNTLITGTLSIGENDSSSQGYKVYVADANNTTRIEGKLSVGAKSTLSAVEVQGDTTIISGKSISFSGFNDTTKIESNKITSTTFNGVNIKKVAIVIN